MNDSTATPMSVEWFGMVMGLGFVLSWGYWCNDFRVVQHAMGAKDMNAARRPPPSRTSPRCSSPRWSSCPA